MVNGDSPHRSVLKATALSLHARKKLTEKTNEKMYLPGYPENVSKPARICGLPILVINSGICQVIFESIYFKAIPSR